VENYLKQALAEKQFFYSAELVLGRDHDVPEAETFVRDASQEPEGVKVISTTDLPGGNPALPPEAFMSFVHEHGLTPIAHLSGKDGNRSFLEARLHSLARMGVENILALTGDSPKDASIGKPKPVFDMDSTLILTLVEQLCEGLKYRLGPREIQTTPFDFLPGAVAGPYKVDEADQMMQFYKLKLKLAAGARFIIPQLGWDMRKLNELKQYMDREGLGHIPVMANVYVPTATVAKLMQAAEVPGCVVTDELISRLSQEKKPQRLERAAVMVAAARSLGFAGAHIGGFGLAHKDFMKIIDRSGEIGEEWRGRVDEIVFGEPDQFHLFPQGSDGMSDGSGEYQLSQKRPRRKMAQRTGRIAHRMFMDEESFGARFLASRLGVKDNPPTDDSWRHGFWYKFLGSVSGMYRKNALNCLMCGDCLVEHLNYAVCPVSGCAKELRNGPCGGSRIDGTCEVYPEKDCAWGLSYKGALAVKEDPEKFATTLIPPREWSLDQKSPMANMLARLDNYTRRKTVEIKKDVQ